MDALLQGLKLSPVVAIIRGIEPHDAEAAAIALYEGGIRLMKLTMNSPAPAESIALMKDALKNFGDTHVGAGTVSSLQRLSEAVEAGAEFIISPNTEASVIKETKCLGLLSMPGFFTPSEAFAAMDAGADVLKLFPCSTLGPSYIKDIKAVVDAPIVAVGGVSLDNIASYLKVSFGVGIGSSLYKPGIPHAELRSRAQQYVSAAKGA